MKIKRPSLPLSEVNESNLNCIANTLGCKSWRVMLREIAEGKLNVSRPKSGHVFDAMNYAMATKPIQVPAQKPAWNTPVGEFVTEREDGYFVDTEEFDKPVPQKKHVVAAEAPSTTSNVKIPQYGSKEEKIAALAKLGLMKGSEL